MAGRTSQAPLRLASRRVVLPDGMVGPATVTAEDGRISAVDRTIVAGAFDLGDLLLAPGLVDLHGDAFERQLMPRPGVMVDAGVALFDTDRQLAAGGITTACHGLTWSWEPGLRSMATGRAFMALVARAAPALLVEHHIHLRLETYNLDGIGEALELIANGRITLLAFNDHTPGMAEAALKPTGNIGHAYRALVPTGEFNALALRVAARAAAVPAAIEQVAAACRAAGVPMLSHDDDTPETRQRFHVLGARVCEFPKNEATARHALALGNPVVMGAPNVLRGRSHLGWISAIEAVEAGLCTILASDYYYPALLQAPFRLAERRLASLGEAWRLVSANPADAAGLGDRGRIEPGCRADLLAVAEGDGLPPRVLQTWRAGRVVFGQLA